MKLMNPSKKKKETYNPNCTIEDILHSLDMTEKDYYEALPTAAGTDYELHLNAHQIAVLSIIIIPLF